MHFNQQEQYTAIMSWLETAGDAAPPHGLSDVSAAEAVKFIHSIVNKYSSGRVPAGRRLAAAALLSHAPVAALRRLELFIDAVGEALPADLPDETAHILARVAAASQAMTRRLAGSPDLIAELARLENPLAPRTDRAYYLAAAAGSPGTGETIRDIHRFQTVQLCRICARNTDASIPIEEITCEISLLAEAVIERVLALVHHDICGRLGTGERPHTLVVLGLGKLGGRELNVSSDIDLIYLCAPDSTQWGRYDSLSYHIQLAERLTRTLSEATPLGFLYRVDTRLKADGTGGPLVRTPEDYFRYLEMRGEAWERQMLLKARPVAGVHAIGERFLAGIERFVYPASIARTPHREVVAIKDRIEARLGTEAGDRTVLKTAPGGVRDIEFIAQCLQLLMGGTHLEVRAQGTLPALERLHLAGALSDDEYAVLAAAYRHYRTVENALQWREFRPDFTIPDDEAARIEVASFVEGRPVDPKGAEAFFAGLDRRMAAVRSVYESVFGMGGEDDAAELAVLAALNPAGDDRVRRYLEGLGFRDPRESARTLSRLVFGESGKTPDAGIHPAVERFLPRLLGACGDLPDPGSALDRFERVVAAYHSRHILFDILTGREALFELLLTAVHASGFVTDILVQDPSLLDWLVDVGAIVEPVDAAALWRELADLDRRARNDAAFTRGCLALRNREQLRIAFRDISGLAREGETFRQLTVVAEILTFAAAERTAGNGQLPFGFAVLAAGRLGAGTMDFGSDLDLIFVYDNPRPGETAAETPQHAESLARRIIMLLTGGGGPVKVYDVDARLRPEGGNAPLAVSLGDFRSYLESRAAAWERIALVRARPVGGGKQTGAAAVEAIHGFCYRGPFTRGEIARLREIRGSMADQSRKRSAEGTNVKSGEGGIADIDFTAQILSAHYGADHPNIRLRETPAILEALAAEGLLDPGDAAALKERYRFLCDVEKALRIGSGRSVNVVPADETETARVARLLEFRNVRRFRKRLDETIARTRELYLRIMDDLACRAPDDTAT